MLDDKLLKAFMFGFYGYGNYDAKYWFIGMEEHIKKSSLEKMERKFEQRLNVWGERGRNELEDLRDFQQALGKKHPERVPYVPTWRKIIHVLYGIKGQKPTKTEIREYQSIKLGRTRGDSYLVELLPLPSPNTNYFYFNKFSNLPWLRTRKVYVEHVKKRRIAHLTKKIQDHRPEAVVFYGKGNWKDYRKVAGVEFQSTKIDGVKIGDNGRTIFILAKAPVAFGATNRDFYGIGRMIAEGVVGPRR